MIDLRIIQNRFRELPGCLRCGKVLLILLLFRWAASLLFGRLLVWNVVALAGPVLVASALEGSPGGGVLGCASGGRGGHVE